MEGEDKHILLCTWEPYAFFFFLITIVVYIKKCKAPLSTQEEYT
jgi:hypothetical protein